MGINFDIITVIHQASITDWIQAIAALLAVAGTVATLWKLYQRDEQKQAMIAELQKQTSGLAAQTRELNAQVFQLGNIHQAIAEGIAVMTHDVQIKERNRRNELRPHLVLDTVKPAEYGQGIQYNFFNKGGNAEDVTMLHFQGDGKQYQAQFRAENGQYIVIELYQPRPFEQEWRFEFHYTDADGVPYKQIVSRKKGHAFEPDVTPPIPRDVDAPTNDD